MNHVTGSAYAYVQAAGAGCFTCMCGVVGGLGAATWVATTRVRYDIALHVALSPLLGIVHMGLPAAVPATLVGLGLVAFDEPAALPYLEIFQSPKAAAALVLCTVLQVSLIMLTTSSKRLRCMLLLLTAVSDAMEYPLHVMLLRAILKSPVYRPPSWHHVCAAFARCGTSLAAAAVVAVGPTRMRCTDADEAECTPARRAKLLASLAAAGYGTSSAQLGESPIESRISSKVLALNAQQTLHTTGPTYSSQMGGHRMSMKLYDVDHNCRGLEGRTAEAVMEDFGSLILERAERQGMKLSVSFHNAALTAGCIALTCNMEIADENGPLGEEARAAVLSMFDLPALMTHAVTGAPPAEGDKACIQHGDASPTAPMLFSQECKGFVADSSISNESNADDRQQLATHLCVLNPLLVVPPLGTRKLPLQVTIDIPAHKVGDSCELLVSFAPHSMRRLAGPLLRTPLARLLAQAAERGSPAGVLDLEIFLGLLPQSGIINVTLMDKGRVVTTDAVPLLPAFSRAAVAELRARHLEYATAKSLAIDLSALLAPLHRCSDRVVTLKIAEALSLWLHDSGGMPMAEKLVRMGVKAVLTSPPRSRSRPPSSSGAPSSVTSSHQVAFAWVQVAMLWTFIARDCFVATSRPLVSAIWALHGVPAYVDIGARLAPGTAARMAAWLPRRVSNNGNACRRIFRALMGMTVAMYNPTHPFAVAHWLFLDIAVYIVVQAFEPLPTLKSSLLVLFCAEVPALLLASIFSVVKYGEQLLSPSLILRYAVSITVLVLVNVRVQRANVRREKRKHA